MPRPKPFNVTVARDLFVAAWAAQFSAPGDVIPVSDREVAVAAIRAAGVFDAECSAAVRASEEE